MSDTIRIGIIGTKFAGEFHADVWRKIPNAQVVAAADLDEETRNAFIDKYDIEKGYGDYRELIENPEIDVVDICLPNFLHAEAAAAAFEAGKHVISEKPFATTIDDGKRVLEAQRKSGLKYFYAEDWLFAPALVRARSIVEEGGIGELHYCTGKECHNGSHSPFAQKKAFCGGGALIHLGIHPISFFYSIFGEPVSVSGKCSGGGERNMVHKTLEVEDWGIGLLTFKDNRYATIEANYITTGGMDDKIEFYGSGGVIKVDLTFGSPLQVYSRKGYAYAVEKADFTHGWTRPAVDEFYNLGYRDELAHFLDCISGKTSEQARGTKAEDGFAVLKTVLAVYESNETGREVIL